MNAPSFALTEPLAKEEVPRSSVCCSWKVFTLLSLPVALAFAVFLREGQHASIQEPVISMAWQNSHPTQAWRFPQIARPPQVMQPARVWQSLRPTQVQHFAQLISAAASSDATQVAENAATTAAVADNLKDLPQTPHPPGLAEDSSFKLHESVTAWKNFQRDGSPSAIDNLREAASIGLSIATQDTNGGVYALAHGVRTAYFAANSVLSTLAVGLNTRINPDPADSGEGGLYSGGDNSLYSGGDTSVDNGKIVSRFLLESAMSFQQDYHEINKGMYKTPWDMYTPGHRQLTPQYAAQQTGRAIEEAIAITSKGMRGGLPSDIGIWLESPLYPDYYKNNFHFQTDGWMASRSAKVYETSTENLFFGRQDAMQRLSLLPLHNMDASKKGAPRILEVACGTGRFATFIRDNHPTADLTLVDLSPFYLEAARENDEYWRKLRFPNQETRPPAAKFVQAAAEALPFEDASFDAVVCVYLFHEMPEAARAKAAAEMARVVAPGGVVILTDSVQLGDRPDMDRSLVNFKKLNEPHYENYVNTYLPALFEAGGLKCDGKWVESVSKCVSFRKPAQESP